MFLNILPCTLPVLNKNAFIYKNIYFSNLNEKKEDAAPHYGDGIL